MKKRKKQIIFLMAVAVFAVAAVVLWMVKSIEDPFSSEFSENKREDVVVYGGKKYKYNEHLSNYLFLGIDRREEVDKYKTRGGAGQADAIYLISYNRVENTLKCLAIPRDTMARIHVIGVNGTDLGYTKDHINIQYAFGDGKTESCQLMKEAVSEMLYGLPIQGYCSLNMDGIPIAAKVLKGVELVVPDDTLEQVNPEFKQGETVLITEANAEQFVRYRDITVAQSAISRMERQKVFLKASAEKAKKQFSKDPGFVVDMYDNLKPYMVTNMGNDLFAKLLQATFDFNEKIQDIPGKKVDGIDYDEYYINEDQLYELILQMFYKEVRDD